MSQIETTCALIRRWHRQRLFAMDQRKRSDNALGGYLRYSLGWHRDLPAAEGKAILDRVNTAIAVGEARDKGTVLEDDLYDEFASVIDASIRSRKPFDMIEAEATKRMENLAKTLPVWQAWAVDILGVSPRTVATIVGEAGDLAKYPSHSKLWKRMGVAVNDDGVRQGGLRKSATAEEWIGQKYSPRRRSLLWVIGDVLIKQSRGPYRAVYDERKAFEIAKAEAAGKIVEAASKNTKQQPDKYMSKMHVHRRAQRYVEKRLLRDLWRAWNANSDANETTATTSMTRRAEIDLPEFARTSPQTGV